MEQNIRILIVDENAEFRKSCRDNLSGFGYRMIDEAADGDEALFRIEKTHFYHYSLSACTLCLPQQQQVRSSA